MDSKKIRAFLTVRDKGSLTHAAELLNYTQSGLTHMMNALEKELNVPLLRRGRNGVRLTAEAERLLPKFEALVAAQDELDKELERLRFGAGARLRIGAYTSMAQHWLPTILSDYREKNPDCELTLRMGGMELYEAVAEETLDCAFVSYQAERMTEHMDWVPLRNDELVAVLPEQYPVKGGLFPVQKFDGAEFLMPSDNFDLDILPTLSRHRISPVIHYTGMDDMTILSMVEHGLGLSILTELVVSGNRDGVQTLPLTPPAYRELGIVLRKKDNAVSRFVEFSRAKVTALYKT